jgi:DNA adenine methylase
MGMMVVRRDATDSAELKAPFPWFGGKRRVTGVVWERFGNVTNYVEPFAGSLAVMLGRPQPFVGTETVNDKDGFIANFWRALQHDPEQVTRYADWPVNEVDQNARHAWLVTQRDTLTTRLEGDPDYYDPKIAGWWVWGICCWIGAGWCSGEGPWQVVDGQLVHLGDAGQGVNRQLVHLGDAGRGVNRQRVHLGDAGRGVNRQLVHLGNAGRGETASESGLLAWMLTLAERLRLVRVCCGDWTRVCGPTPTVKLGLTGVFLDPPYAQDIRTDNLYSVETDVSRAVREWAIANGDDPRIRIALCGYEGEHEMPDDWEVYAWSTAGGYASQSSVGNSNRHLERIWFSPHCVKPLRMATLFDELPLVAATNPDQTTPALVGADEAAG